MAHTSNDTSPAADVRSTAPPDVSELDRAHHGPAEHEGPVPDPFDANVTDPNPLYARLRAMGPAVRLPRHSGLWAVAGFDTADAILHDSTTFTSTRGVGLDPGMADQMGPGEIILHADPPRHDVLRSILHTQLGPAGLRRRQPRINRLAAIAASVAVAQRNIDGIALARLLAVTVAAELAGLPASEGRDALSAYSSAAFAAFGPASPDRDDGLEHIAGLVDYLTAMVRDERLAPGSAGADILAAARADRIDAPTVIQMLAALVTAGIDTTLHALGNLLWLLGTHNDEWARMRAGQVSVDDVIAESLRLLSPIAVLTRTVTVDHYLPADPYFGPQDQQGVHLHAGDRVAVLFGAANRDPRRWADPERFWPGRPHRPHLTFGRGLHACMGRALACAELHALLGALLDTAKEIHVDTCGAVRLRHAVLTGFARLPLALIPAPDRGDPASVSPPRRDDQPTNNHGNSGQ